MSELDLLRRYEPVVRFTLGEHFFPCAVDIFLAQCSLWLATGELERTQLAGPGELTTENIGHYRTIAPDSRLYLQYVADPLSPTQYQQWRRNSGLPELEHPNRLQRVGLVNRIIDGIFDLSLLVRGRVPGGTAAAAQIQYQALLDHDRQRVYYGRVLRRGGYTVLHYLYFYVMNDWRSTFHGVNDHESDWEQVFVYLSDSPEGAIKELDETPDSSPLGEREKVLDPDQLTPLWVAYASHDFSGDDLRRRWDDPELEKIDATHPVIYAGAGSHASYFQSGEYLMHAEPGFLSPLHGIGAALDRFWSHTLRQSGDLNLSSGLKSLFRIPFVDYARGDGLAIGPGQPEEWTPILISDEVAWVDNYRGLWGLDTQDPLGGERAPAGPKYRRDGTVRSSWNAVLAWSGLDKVPPPQQAVRDLNALEQDLLQERAGFADAIVAQRNAVRQLEIELDALRQSAYHGELLARRRRDLEEAEGELHGQMQRLADVRETSQAVSDRIRQLQSGDFGSPKAHLLHAHTPLTPLPPAGKVQMAWVAVSGGLILLVLAALIVARPANWPLWLGGILLFFGGVEAATRHRLPIFLVRLTVVLALITSAILIWRFWLLALVLLLVGLVFLMIRDNLRETFGG